MHETTAATQGKRMKSASYGAPLAGNGAAEFKGAGPGPAAGLDAARGLPSMPLFEVAAAGPKARRLPARG